MTVDKKGNTILVVEHDAEIMRAADRVVDLGPGAGERCTLWIHTHVREEALALYGFLTTEERELFLLLIGVPKVGPKHAMAVLGGLPLDELLRCIAGGEQRRLASRRRDIEQVDVHVQTTDDDDATLHVPTPFP